MSAMRQTTLLSSTMGTQFRHQQLDAHQNGHEPSTVVHSLPYTHGEQGVLMPIDRHTLVCPWHEGDKSVPTHRSISQYRKVAYDGSYTQNKQLHPHQHSIRQAATNQGQGMTMEVDRRSSCRSTLVAAYTAPQLHGAPATIAHLWPRPANRAPGQSVPPSP